MSNLMSVEKSLGTKVCSGDGMIYSQPAEAIQDQGPALTIKKNQVYIPPHRRSSQDWQEHMKRDSLASNGT